VIQDQITREIEAALQNHRLRSGHCRRDSTSVFRPGMRSRQASSNRRAVPHLAGKRGHRAVEDFSELFVLFWRISEARLPEKFLDNSFAVLNPHRASRKCVWKLKGIVLASRPCRAPKSSPVRRAQQLAYGSQFESRGRSHKKKHRRPTSQRSGEIFGPSESSLAAGGPAPNSCVDLDHPSGKHGIPGLVAVTSALPTPCIRA